MVFLFILFTCLFTKEIRAEKSPPPLKIVYFVPSDKQPLEDRQERLGRVMKYVQDFYRSEMQRNGYGPKTFALEWDAPGKLKLYIVKGKKEAHQYGRDDAYVVSDEVRQALAEQQINTRNEVVVIFQMLLDWKDGVATEIGPYVGGGSHLSGTAWVYEDAKLDSDLLSSKEPGGYYHGPCSIGKFNTHYIGGTAHEMGHAFSLPHDCQLDSEQKEMSAVSLMGAGNHTFGQNLRGEGVGTFLSPASAMRLSTVRAFAGDLPNAQTQPKWEIKELAATVKPSADAAKAPEFTLSGNIAATPELVGIIAYNDDMTINSDYDAKAWTTVPEKDGSFKIEINELKAVPYQLRLVGIHANGASSVLKCDYMVEKKDSGYSVDLSPINDVKMLDNLVSSYNNRNSEALEKIANDSAVSKTLREKAKHAIFLLKPRRQIDVAQIPGDEKQADLTFAKFKKSQTGWGPARFGNVPEDIFISVDGKFFKSGLYAHAPSVYEVDLDGKWKTLEIGFGLQDGHAGEVRFVINGDGKELYRSEVVSDRKFRRQSVRVLGVKTLELSVEHTDAGNGGCWGIWVDPIVKR